MQVSFSKLEFECSTTRSDGEPAMKAVKDAVAKAPGGVESISQESPVGDDQANSDIESTVRTLKAQMRATRFADEAGDMMIQF